ncbi:unnamed protein product [Cuscuta epithymum]|uniref:Uncharacterized protein n=1 Tax=Cuscuta epithymum TaxID=186058 RepID=A0AAV0CEL2_9ASTE|nr:unnamed protein product [Cuscuta epithymum]
MSTMNPLMNLQNKLCYVKCGNCNTILLVSVPRSSLSTAAVTVRCGHCAAILSVNMMIRTSCFQLPFHHFASLDHHHHEFAKEGEADEEKGNASNPTNMKKKCSFLDDVKDDDDDDDDMVDDDIKIAATKPPEKRQRPPSAYNCFIKEEIKRLKGSNPCLSHKQAFSAASKNWAHLKPSQRQNNEGGSRGGQHSDIHM